MQKRTSAAMVLVLLATGCAGTIRSLHMQESEGLTGCLQSEMTYQDLTDPHYAPGGGPWTIQCRGKTFLCSQLGQAPAACHER